MAGPNRRQVVITGTGVISPLGGTATDLHASLCAGADALRPPSAFDTSSCANGLAAEVDFDPVVELVGRNFRPLDRTARLATIAASRALEASGWTAEQRAEHEVGLALGTMFGSVETISSFDLRAQTAGPQYAKPLDFANSVINAAAGQTAIWHDLRGVNATIAGGPAAGLLAIAYAAELIATGRADALLAGGCDELCFASYMGYYSRGELAGSRNGTAARPIPFDSERNGFALGEGAALLMLEARESATRRGARILGTVRGHANGFDCSRGGDEAEAMATVARTVRAALDDAGLDGATIDVVYAGANGSVEGDRREAQGLLEALGDAGRGVPVTAPKSMLGESLGAGGALAAVALLEAFDRGEVPGIRGLARRDADLPLGGAAVETRAALLRHGLIDAIGFDGQASALVLSRERRS